MAASRLLQRFRSFGINGKFRCCRQLMQQQIVQQIHRHYSKQSSLWEAYHRTKKLTAELKLPADVDPSAVFANNELDMDNIDIYGFDYDYTLACYHDNLLFLIYNLAKEVLVTKYKYPVDIAALEYVPNFAIRGLHYDIQKGLLMKIDSFHQIQTSSVYRGRKQMTEDHVLLEYGQITLPKAYVEGPFFTGKNAPMQHLTDLFSLPEMMLLVNVQDHFETNGISYSPEILFWDVKQSVQSIHPVMHSVVQNHVETYLKKNPKLRPFLERLINHGKKLFIVTNSPYPFVNKGMNYIIGEDWRDLFELVVVRARKPNFFSNELRPFRLFDTLLNSRTWEKVVRLEKGKVYMEGSLTELKQMTGWTSPQSVLYFGDHLYSDLADLTLQYGWRTGAIITEVADEIVLQNTEEYKRSIKWLEELQDLIADMQEYEDSESASIIREWEKERDLLRQRTKTVFNTQFGSLFRTHHNPTYFSRRLFRFADVYMSNLTNMLHYSMKHTFYPRRGVLPHEFRIPP